MSNPKMLFERIKLFCSPKQSGTWGMRLITLTSTIRRALASWRKETAGEELVDKNATHNVMLFSAKPIEFKHFSDNE